MRRAIALVVLLAAAGCRRPAPEVTPGGRPAGATQGPTGAGDPGDLGEADSTRDPSARDSETRGASGDPPEGGDPEGERADGFDATLESIPRRPREPGHPGSSPGRGCEGGARAIGERWQVECNTCTCEASGAVTCTVMACLPAAEPGRPRR